MNPARHHLRTATRATHERTDAAFSVLDLSMRADYAVFLGSHWLAYTALEPVFELHLPTDQRPPAMAELLAADLLALGEKQPTLPAPDFDGDALGAAYVVAGSHFGKRVLSRRHGQTQDEQVRGAGRYLSSTALTGYWPVLQFAVEDAGDDPERLDQITAGADAAFALFATCLEQVRRSAALPFRRAL